MTMKLTTEEKAALETKMIDRLYEVIANVYRNLFGQVDPPRNFFGFEIEKDPEGFEKIVANNGFVEVLANVPDEKPLSGNRFSSFTIVTIYSDDAEWQEVIGDVPAARLFFQEMMRMQIEITNASQYMYSRQPKGWRPAAPVLA